MSRKRRQPAEVVRTKSDLARSLQLSVTVPNRGSDEAEYVRIGPEHPLWHERIAATTAQAARNGDTDAAYEILRDFVGAVDQFSERTWRGPVYWAYARYIADAFEKIIRAAMRGGAWHGTKWSDAETGEAQADANLALGIKSSKPGRRKGTRTHSDDALAAALNLLLLNGFTRKAAKYDLRQQTSASFSTIERADTAHDSYRMYREHAMNPNTSPEDRDFAAGVIKNGAEPLVSKIGPILAGKKKR